MTISEMLTRFITSKRAMGASNYTIRWYRCIVGKFDTWVEGQGDPPLSNDLIELYFVHLRDRHKADNSKPMADASVMSIYRALRTFFKWCKTKKLISEDPMVEFKLMRPDPKEPRLATREEVDRLLRSIPVNDWIGLRDYLIVHIIFFGALRVGELVKLEAHHFDVQGEILHVPGGKTGAGTVPMLRELIEAFLAFQTHRPASPEPRLLLSSDGHNMPNGALTDSGVRHMLRRRCRDAGLRNLSPHAFRHGWYQVPAYARSFRKNRRGS